MPTLQAAWDRHHHQQPSQFQKLPAQQHNPRDVSSLHPVFFTGRLRRSSSVPTTATGGPLAAAGISGLINPVAHGYVEERLGRRPGGPML
ncbi:hypothetical protein CHU98_g11818 [Xylaria longipes]|nr:hypothetical protein CHU98_g11818 [Xylaria longipes]